ncbi:MAG: phytanoyl-CoA dioxygenase family protein [Dongiaceae bacterium]
MLRVPVLTDPQIGAHKRDGFVVLRAAFDAAEMRRIEGMAAEAAAMPEEPGRHWVFHERSRLDSRQDLISRIEYLAPFHAGFAELCEALKPSAAQLLGEPAVLFKEKINFKMAGGDGFKPHQDSQAGWETYASIFVTVALTIDEATAANGCLRIVAGHHKRGLFRAWEPLTDEDMAGMRFVDCPTRPGDLVFIDSYAPHASEPNLSDGLRRLYFATYNRLSEGDHMARYYADKRKNYPPDIEREPGRQYVFRV